MGAACCNVDSQNEGIIAESLFDSVEEIPFLDTTDQNQNEEAEHKIWKHRNNDLYYCGEWVNGFAQGKGTLYKSKRTFYKGNFERGILNGAGLYSCAEKNAVFQGSFLDGRAHGKGKITNEQLNIVFEGEWFNGKPTGGVFRFDSPGNTIVNITVADFEENNACITFKDQSEYRGEIDSNLQPSGKGRLNFSASSPASHYQGSWQQGLYHGQGEYHWKDGSLYNGQYSYGKKQGQGKFIFASKKYYTGHWLAGDKNGRGSLCRENGEVIEQGIWQKGKLVMGLTDQQMAMESEGVKSNG